MKNLAALLFIALGLIAAGVFSISSAFSLPLWGKIACGLLWVINLYVSINADKWAEQGKFSLNPVLSFIVQVGLSFLLVAITA